MTGRHDRSVDLDYSQNLLMTGPIVIRGLGRGVKDAFGANRPSRHRSGEDDADAALPQDDGDEATERSPEPMTDDPSAEYADGGSPAGGGDLPSGTAQVQQDTAASDHQPQAEEPAAPEQVVAEPPADGEAVGDPLDAESSAAGSVAGTPEDADSAEVGPTGDAGVQLPSDAEHPRALDATGTPEGAAPASAPSERSDPHTGIDGGERDQGVQDARGDGAHNRPGRNAER